LFQLRADSIYFKQVINEYVKQSVDKQRTDFMYSTKEVENFSCFDRGCGLDQYCAEYGSVAGFCMHGSEH